VVVPRTAPHHNPRKYHRVATLILDFAPSTTGYFLNCPPVEWYHRHKIWSPRENVSHEISPAWVLWGPHIRWHESLDSGEGMLLRPSNPKPSHLCWDRNTATQAASYLTESHPRDPYYSHNLENPSRKGLGGCFLVPNFRKLNRNFHLLSESILMTFKIGVDPC
jgi:hypothetical protein